MDLESDGTERTKKPFCVHKNEVSLSLAWTTLQKLFHLVHILNSTWLASHSQRNTSFHFLRGRDSGTVAKLVLCLFRQLSLVHVSGFCILFQISFWFCIELRKTRRQRSGIEMHCVTFAVVWCERSLKRRFHCFNWWTDFRLKLQLAKKHAHLWIVSRYF